jgi:hypothetical protein
VPADGYLRRVLADGALPFRYRGSVRALLGEPDGPGLLRATPPAPQPQFSYPRPAWLGEIELPDAISAMGTGFQDWRARNDPPRSHGERGTVAGGVSHGTPEKLPEPGTDHPPALPRPAVTARQAPRPGTAASPSAALEVSRAAVPGPTHVAPTGPPHAAQPPITEPARQMAAETTRTLVAGLARPQEPHADPGTDARPGPVRPTTAAGQPGPEPAAPAGGSREMQIPGRTTRSPVRTGSEEVGAGPDPSGLTRQVSMRQPLGPLRRSGAEPAGTTGRESATTDSSGDLSTPGPGRTVRRIPPHHMSTTAPNHDGGALIPGGQATPLRVRQPAGLGRLADILPVGQADTFPLRRPASEAGIRSRAEQPPPPAPVAAPQLIVMLTPRTPTARPAFWERRHLGRLWSRPLR